MLTEPDMQARYVAAALGVIEAELRSSDATAGGRRALAVLDASVARVAARLADDLGGQAVTTRPALATFVHRNNVVAFKR
jgi:putative heme degradation protein